MGCSWKLYLFFLDNGFLVFNLKIFNLKSEMRRVLPGQRILEHLICPKLPSLLQDTPLSLASDNGTFVSSAIGGIHSVFMMFSFLLEISPVWFVVTAGHLMSSVLITDLLTCSLFFVKGKRANETVKLLVKSIDNWVYSACFKR